MDRTRLRRLAERRISDLGRSFIVATVSDYVGIAGVVFAAASFAR